MIKVIVGLGNPGAKYEKTRHNVGFLFLNHLAESQGSRWAEVVQFQGDVAHISCGPDKLILLKPMTFMNKSGLSVGRVLRYYKFKPHELLVVHDELELPETAIKMKRDGGHAGHNGLRDIIANIDSRDFFRLRVGIGRPVSGSNIADYVLSKPSNQTLLNFDEAFQDLEARLGAVIAGDIEGLNAALVNKDF